MYILKLFIANILIWLKKRSYKLLPVLFLGSEFRYRLRNLQLLERIRGQEACNLSSESFCNQYACFFFFYFLLFLLPQLMIVLFSFINKVLKSSVVTYFQYNTTEILVDPRYTVIVSLSVYPYKSLFPFLDEICHTFVFSRGIDFYFILFVFFCFLLFSVSLYTNVVIYK